MKNEGEKIKYLVARLLLKRKAILTQYASELKYSEEQTPERGKEIYDNLIETLCKIDKGTNYIPEIGLKGCVEVIQKVQRFQRHCR